ncbi:MAG TPA: universal stress protein [Solirubrobacteraceae bacterium]|nr:universal stress protein [Solirubrobacteraceae bacterium]
MRAGKIAHERKLMTLSNTSLHSAVWDRVVCGIDLTPASLQAAREAAQLMPSAAQLTLCTIVSGGDAGRGTALDRMLARDASAALDDVQREIDAFHSSELHLREGPRIRRLMEELVSVRATLVAIGSHRDDRAAEATLGSIATAMLHEAPCSVLIAHDTGGSPRSTDGELVVGFDGSGGAHRAFAVGRELSERLSLDLRVLVATGEPTAPAAGWSRDDLGPELRVTEDPRTAADALADASHSARLLIVGSRHLRGAIARASISERVSLAASCPVLVVR